MADKINVNFYDGESQAMRSARIGESCNGSTLRTRVIRDKSKYTRKIKHKNSNLLN